MVAEKIREHSELSGATMMMLSSAMPRGADTRCKEVAVASYLMKPVNQAELIDAILIAIHRTVEAKPEPAAGAIIQSEISLRILLAEDNVANRAVASGILKKCGHSLVHAVDGHEAVEAAKCESSDLILMDV